MPIYQPRSEAVQRAYEEFAATHDCSVFVLADEHIVRAFEHWVIIENRFPYDNMARTNHLLIARDSLFDLNDAPNAVKTEYELIMSQLAAEGAYDAKIENFPKATSVKTHFHVHLICWHNGRA